MGVVPDETTLSRHDGTSSWGTITTVAESPITADVLYVGTDDGNVQVSRDGGQTWTNLAGKFPDFEDERATVSRVVASNGAPGRAYASFDRHQLGDFSPHIFITDDYGETWRAIDSDLPQVGWVNVIVEHPRNPDLLFAGTETGLFVTLDSGEGWRRLTGNFPTVPVDDLVIHPRDNDLVVGTHGRGIYILDDLTPLEQLTSAVRESKVHLFDVRAATEFLPWKHESYGAQREFVGDNPPYGAILSYYLGSEPEETVSLNILDGDGSILRKLEGGRESGVHRAQWDLRIGLPEGLASGRGPLVPPGRYTVQLLSGGQSLETTVEVKLDPRIEIPAGELQARYDFLVASNRLRATIQDAVTSIAVIETQIANLLQEREGESPGPWQSAARELSAEAERIRERLSGPSGGSSFRNPSPERVAGQLFRELDGDQVRQGTLHGPTATERQRLTSITRTVEEQTALLNRLIEFSIPDLNRQIGEANLPWIRAGDPVERSRRD